ncbi:hypothetical protein BDZ89DRAFT_1068735 [Hymenopellis radicata]|nr:hypothetical protein BDZ89DRAFT_1068735 [Hymenopellis radicata]
MASDASGSPSGLTESSLGNILELLRSGRTAPGASVSDVSNRVSALEDRSQQLKDEVARLALLITRKEEEIASTEMEIAQTKSLLAPIRSIPPEILLHIFSLVGGSFPFATCYSDDVFNQHLVLSNPRPLDISLDLESLSDVECRDVVTTLLQRLSGHASRWRSFDIDGPADAIELFVAFLDGLDLTILASLKVSYNMLEIATPLSSGIYEVTLPPSLRTLDMNISFDTFHILNVHWSALTSFTGPFSDPGSFYRFIGMTRQLVSLHVTCIGDSQGSDRGQPVVHENLRRLTLNVPCSMSPVLDKMSFPNVDELNLSHQGDDETHGTCAGRPHQNGEALLCRLVERSRCTPTTLSLDCEVTPLHLRSILRMPSIVSLRLVLGCDTLPETSEFLDALTINPSEKLLPSLRELEISTNTLYDHLFNNERLQTMILSRWNVAPNAARLSKLALFKLHHRFPEDPRPLYSTSSLALLLLDMQDNGLDVSWIINEFDLLKEGKEYRESLF